ncbi:DUF3306 domain-containing protein [Pseudophaeobacter arcticus]|uniref:DUF3306 domain-containing protein n=1 Tax=Pseudophaeobacter arcticus TaxID=385492 RepID=UPI002490A287|nr:DUF3306 domain-containing protein [Pseudophaeobacter arcticus]
MSRGDFWSRRQAAVAAEAEAEQRAVVAAQSAAREAELAEQSDDEILASLDLPAPESLKDGDDFKIFLTDQIPARIKTRALRHLWRANPVLACVDGLVDYGEDFTDAACVIEGMQTAYQVGKGMTKHVQALAQEAEAERLAAETQPQPDPQASPTQETVSPCDAPSVAYSTPGQGDQRADDLAEAQADLAEAQANLVEAQADLDEDTAQLGEPPIPAAPRRMRFSFAEAQA